MPPSPPTGSQQIHHITTAPDHWYVNFTDAVDTDHNNHLVIAWAVLADDETVVPLITDPSNGRDIIQANTVSENYTILNPYNQCPVCVRPPVVSS